MEKQALDALSRQQLEHLIDAAIDRLDALCGDPDLEDDDREPEETDQNQDELDYSGYEGEYTIGSGPSYDGSGVIVASNLIAGNAPAKKRAKQVSDAPPTPVLYDFRGR